jgi:hypothetical protein
MMHAGRGHFGRSSPSSCDRDGDADIAVEEAEEHKHDTYNSTKWTHDQVEDGALANVIVDQKVDSMINQFGSGDPHSLVPVSDQKGKKRWWKEM